MEIDIICEAYEEEKIIDVIKNYFEAAEFNLISKARECSLHKYKTAVISHNFVSKLKDFVFSEFDTIYIFYYGHIFDITNAEGLIDERRKAVENRDWKRAKAANSVLIDMDFLKKNYKSIGLPDYLQIETTSHCNAKCIMCSHYFNGNKNAENLNNNILKNIEDAICLSRTISLNGMGEPFVSENVSDQIDFYAAFGNKIVTNTNLSVLNDRLLKQINECFEWLEISCDGAEKSTYESIRKNLDFDTLIKNLEVLKEKCPNVRKHIASVVMRQNVKEMPKMVELAFKAKASIITFMTLNSNIIIHNAHDEMNRYPKVMEYYSVMALKMGKKLGIDVVVPNEHSLNMEIKFDDIKQQLVEMESIPMYKSENDEKDMLKIAAIVNAYLEEHDEIQTDTKASDIKCSGICDWILKRSYIDLNGNAAMCCRNQSFHTGNVNKMGSFSSVWNSEFYKKLRQIFYSGHLPESCLKCGLIESGNLEYLEVEVTQDFYRDAEYKLRQKAVLTELLKEN